MKKMEEFYRASLLAPPQPNSYPLFFPSINNYYDKVQKIGVLFKYVHALEEDPACVTFLARTDSSKNVVIKFVDRYGFQVHKFLAEHQYAPQLLYYGPIDPNGPSYGSLRMVVMEHVEGRTLFKIQQGLLPISHSHPFICPALNHILSLLHNHDFVHGDLRSPNIIITEENKIKIIDFDWAGKAGVARYPPLLSSEITWPSGAEGDELITQDHDREMISNCIKYSKISVKHSRNSSPRKSHSRNSSPRKSVSRSTRSRASESVSRNTRSRGLSSSRRL
jgi:serine/threonine protein kinase